MDTTFLTIFDAETPVPTSAITSIRATTEKERVVVSLGMADSGGRLGSFFSTTLYAYNKVVEIADVATLIEQQFRSRDITNAIVTCTIDGVQMQINTFYCEVELPSFDPAAGFYSPAQSQIVHRGSAISLTHQDAGHRNYVVDLVGLDSDGQPVAIQKTFTHSGDPGTVSFSVNEILDWALAEQNGKGELLIEKVAYFAISYERAQKIFYLVDDPSFLVFGFKNYFNAWEYLDIPCTVKQKTKVNRDMATCSGRSIFYDQSTERTFEVETGALTQDEARMVEALAMSRDVDLYCPQDPDRRIFQPEPVLITDHTIETDNDDASLVSMKFTFRFPSNRVRLTFDEVQALSPQRTSIFSDQFTAQFS